MRYEHRFNDRHERMELLKDADFDAYFEELDKLHEEQVGIAQAVMLMAQEAWCVKIECRLPIWYYLHTSTRGHALQLTVWDGYGPVSHYDVDRPEDMQHAMEHIITVTC